MAYTANVFTTPATPTDTYYLLSWDYVDAFGKRFHESIYVRAAVTTAAINAFLVNLQALTNSAIRNVTLVAATVFRNISSANTNGIAAQLYDTNAEIQLIELSRSNPLKPSGTINLNFPIPSYDAPKVRVGGITPSLNTADTDVAAVIAFLRINAGFRYAGDGSLYFGAWGLSGSANSNVGDGSEIDTNAVVGYTV